MYIILLGGMGAGYLFIPLTQNFIGCILLACGISNSKSNSILMRLCVLYENSQNPAQRVYLYQNAFFKISFECVYCRIKFSLDREKCFCFITDKRTSSSHFLHIYPVCILYGGDNLFIMKIFIFQQFQICYVISHCTFSRRLRGAQSFQLGINFMTNINLMPTF